jgi:hypothetical protein
MRSAARRCPGDVLRLLDGGGRRWRDAQPFRFRRVAELCTSHFDCVEPPSKLIRTATAPSPASTAANVVRSLSTVTMQPASAVVAWYLAIRWSGYDEQRHSQQYESHESGQHPLGGIQWRGESGGLITCTHDIPLSSHTGDCMRPHSMSSSRGNRQFRRVGGSRPRSPTR